MYKVVSQCQPVLVFWQRRAKLHSVSPVPVYLKQRRHQHIEFLFRLGDTCWFQRRFISDHDLIWHIVRHVGIVKDSLNAGEELCCCYYAKIWQGWEGPRYSLSTSHNTIPPVPRKALLMHFWCLAILKKANAFFRQKLVTSFTYV